MKKGGAVYITTNKNNTTIYTGATEDLVTRMIQHRTGHFPNSFTARYNCTKLVFYESYHHIEEALERERLIKAGSRSKKIKLIEGMNPNWDDLWNEVKGWQIKWFVLRGRTLYSIAYRKIKTDEAVSQL